MRKSTLLVSAAGAILLASAAIALLAPRDLAAAASPAAIPVDLAQASARLAGAVRFKTISYEDRPNASQAEFDGLHRYLETQFPLVHRTLRHQMVGAASLLYVWPGSDPSLKPIMLMAHQDVVPIAPDTEQLWQHAPFAGDIADGYVWGRGAWDDKGNLLALFEALEALIATGVTPRRTIMIASGHDEEIGGAQGAKQIAALLEQQGVRLECVIDEGMLITDGLIEGVDEPVAFIGLAEKGMVNFTLTAQGTPGHSSMPPPHTVIGRVAAAVAKLEADPMPAHLDGVMRQSFAQLAPHMQGLRRLILGNLWLTEPLVRRELAAEPSTNAMLRTTTAATVISGGNKSNVLPGKAQALINFRIRPGDSIAAVKDHIVSSIDDSSVAVEEQPDGQEPSAVSSQSDPGYRWIEQAIGDIAPNVAILPGIVVGGTDSRHMQPLTDDIYRFVPIRVRKEDLARFHGTNERISVENYGDLIRFYARLMTIAAID